MKWKLVSDHKKKLVEENNKVRYYWEHKDTVKKEYYDIFRILYSLYKTNANFMRKWMSVINTYHVFSRLNEEYLARKRHIAYLKDLKWNFFTVWRNSKQTRKAIKVAKDKKNLALVTRAMLCRIQIKQQLIKGNRNRVVSLVFLSYYINCELNYKLKSFVLKSELNSQQSQVVCV